MQVGRIGATVVGCDSDRDGICEFFVFGILFFYLLERESSQSRERCKREERGTHLDVDVPVAILVKEVSIHQFKLANLPAPVLVLFLQLLVWEFGLRVLVEIFHVRMCRGRVEVIIDLFDVFTVISLVTVEAVETFFQDRVFTVPKTKRETKSLMVITAPVRISHLFSQADLKRQGRNSRNTSHSVLTPPIRS